MMTLLRFAAALLAAVSMLPAQAASTKTNVAVGLWVVLPDNGSATLWHHSYVTGAVTAYPLGPSGNGWGNLPSDAITTQLVVAGGSNGQNPEDPPVSRFTTTWRDKDGFERKVETPVTGGESPENHRRALLQHERDVADLAKRHPPAAKDKD